VHAIGFLRMETGDGRDAQLVSWLNTARCRLPSQSYEAFRSELQTILHAPSHKDESIDVALRHIASLLWHADFSDAGNDHMAWITTFEVVLPPPLRSLWSALIREIRQTHSTVVDCESNDVRRPLHDYLEGNMSLSTPEGCKAFAKFAEDSLSAELEQPSGPLCVICKLLPLKPKASALCGHLACSECWDRFMVLKFECPVCGRRVLRQNLVLLKGWGDE